MQTIYFSPMLPAGSPVISSNASEAVSCFISSTMTTSMNFTLAVQVWGTEKMDPRRIKYLACQPLTLACLPLIVLYCLLKFPLT